MSNEIQRIKERIKEYFCKVIDDSERGFMSKEYRNVLTYNKDIQNIIDEEIGIDQQEDIPVQCINGSCPMALSEEYEERGMDVVHSCEECQYHKAKESDYKYIKVNREFVSSILDSFDELRAKANNDDEKHLIWVLMTTLQYCINSVDMKGQEEPVCEWKNIVKQCGYGDVILTNPHNNELSINEEYKYCPYCGCKIKVVE